VTPELSTLVGILVPAVGGMFGLGVAFLARGQAREARLVADLRADIVVLKAERDEAQQDARLLADYAQRLRRQLILAEHDPEPWPEGLIT
jgi:hypothetical protein